MGYFHTSSDSVQSLDGALAARVTGVEGSGRLEQQHLDLRLGHRLVLCPAGDEGSSVTTEVLPALRETTRVWTFTFPNSVMRHCGICSVNARSSSGVGLP
jgi:hypothetical protein